MTFSQVAALAKNTKRINLDPFLARAGQGQALGFPAASYNAVAWISA